MTDAKLSFQLEIIEKRRLSVKRNLKFDDRTARVDLTIDIVGQCSLLITAYICRGLKCSDGH